MFLLHVHVKLGSHNKNEKNRVCIREAALHTRVHREIFQILMSPQGLQKSWNITPCENLYIGSPKIMYAQYYFNLNIILKIQVIEQ